MRFKEVLEYVCQPKRGALLDLDEVMAFLERTRSGDVPVYIAGGDFFVYGIVVPEDLLVGDFIEDIMGWNFGIPGGYGYGYVLNREPIEPEFSEPLEHLRSSVLEGGRPTMFLRHHEIRGTYLEPEQRLIHVLGLHAHPEKASWCAVNHLGELVPVLQSAMSEGWFCTLERGALDKFLVLSRSCLVRVVDVTVRGIFPTATTEGTRVSRPESEIYLRTLTSGGDPVVARGFDVVRVSPDGRRRALLSILGKEPREYATFVINDFKRGQIREVSSNPDCIGNYFVASEFPFGTSPAFFKAEVLTQYRTDPVRFKVLPDSVECAGAWRLPYYLNEEGQVHAYLIDLSHVPFEEQLRWKAFNEAPRGGISKVAYQQDFEAKWDGGYDPLVSLRTVLLGFPQNQVWALGHLPETRTVDFLGYVVTESKKELEDQVGALTQIVVEGVSRSHVNALADALGCRDKQLGSLKQLARVMDTLGVASEDRDWILKPMFEMQELRSAFVAHRGTGSVPGDQRAYWRLMLQRTDKAMRKLAELVTTGVFVRPT